jgi:hypothetical protein
MQYDATMNESEVDTAVRAFLDVRQLSDLPFSWSFCASFRASLSYLKLTLRASLWVQRAEELSQLYPWVAYYCRKYALEEVGFGSGTVGPCPASQNFPVERQGYLLYYSP